MGTAVTQPIIVISDVNLHLERVRRTVVGTVEVPAMGAAGLISTIKCAVRRNVVLFLGKLIASLQDICCLCITGRYCGTTSDYCNAPDCLFDYGPACDANKIPSGTNTSTLSRSPLGSVAVGGVGIYDCQNDGDVALTFDDGPGQYTSELLDLLAQYSAKATFFITGINNGKGEIDNASLQWPSIIK